MLSGPSGGLTFQLCGLELLGTVLVCFIFF